MRKSFLDCPHNNVQQFTECCLDCGYNVYMTKAEYLKQLKEDLSNKEDDETTKEIRRLEKKLGIGEFIENNGQSW